MSRGVNAASIEVVAAKKAQSAGVTGVRPTQLRRTGQNRRRRRRRLETKRRVRRWPKCLLAPMSAPRPKSSEEHTSELQSLMRISYAVFCLKTKNQHEKPTK